MKKMNKKKNKNNISKKLLETVFFDTPNDKSTRRWAGDFSQKQNKKNCIEIWASDFPQSFSVTIYQIDDEDLMKRHQHGHIEMEKRVKSYGNCFDAYIIKYSRAFSKGWGPILYEIAIEIASLFNSGITADRESVSGDAEQIWKKLILNPKYKIDQLDDLQANENDKLTPGNTFDDCNMPDNGTAKSVEELIQLWNLKISRGESKWRFSPLSSLENEKNEFLKNILTKTIKTNDTPILNYLLKNKLLFLTKEASQFQSILKFDYDPFLKTRPKTFDLNKTPSLKEIYEKYL